jgi:hypothetical protein
VWSQVRIWALPARITNCVGRFRRNPAAANIHCMAGIYTIAEYGHALSAPSPGVAQAFSATVV